MNDDGTTYEATIGLLDAHFATKINISCERHHFRVINQEANESVKSYVTRLREAAKNCEFENYSIDAAVIDQVIEKTSSTKLRRKLLMEDKLTLQNLINIASAMELTEEQAKAIEGNNVETESLNAIKTKFKPSRSPEGATNYTLNKGSSLYKKKESANNYKRDGWSNQRKTQTSYQKAPWKCYGCGDPNHGIGASECPALGYECKICGARNHYESVCRKKGKERIEEVRNLKKADMKKICKK